jgi:hypothetical protein
VVFGVGVRSLRLRSATFSVVVGGVSRKKVVERSRDGLARDEDFLVSIQYKQSKQRSLRYECNYTAMACAVCGCGGGGGWGNFVGWVRG